MTLPINLYQETYKVNGNSVRVVADFEDDSIRIMTYGFNQVFSMQDYTNFHGSMHDYVVHKLTEHEEYING